MGRQRVTRQPVEDDPGITGRRSRIFLCGRDQPCHRLAAVGDDHLFAGLRRFDQL